MANEEINNDPAVTEEKDDDILTRKADAFVFEKSDDTDVDESGNEEYDEYVQTKSGQKREKIKSAKKDKSKIKKGYAISSARIKIALIVFLVAVVAVMLLMSPIFGVKSIEVIGNTKIKSEKIISESGISKGENIFAADIAGAIDKISSMDRIKDVIITRDLPSKIVIDVTEETESAYIKMKKNYVGIDPDGRVLAVTSKTEAEVPVVNGIKVNSATTGQFIKTEADNARGKMEIMTKILTEARNQDLLKDIRIIDLNDIKDIHLTLRSDILVNLGEDGKEADNKIEYKIAYLKAIVERIDSQQGGVIELSDTNNVTSRTAEKTE